MSVFDPSLHFIKWSRSFFRYTNVGIEKTNFYSEISDGQNNNLSISIISIPSKNYTYTSMAA